MGGLPFAPLDRMKVHPLGTVQGALKTLEKAEQRMGELVPPATAQRKYQR